jgi:hypothetical protein
MVEILQKDGSWTFDGDAIRIVPGTARSVGPLRRTLGEVRVPLRALAGIAYEPGRRSGRLRLRLRDGADPLLQVTAGRLDAVSDPYRLTVEGDRSGVAEYLVERVRNTLLLSEVPCGPVDRYLLPGPALPVAAVAGDGSAAFDGERIRLEWNWKTDASKSSGGPVTLPLAEVTSVDWLPSHGLDNGHLRFRTPTATGGEVLPARHDRHTVELWGFRGDPVLALVGAAVVARLPHPSGARRPGPGPAQAQAPESAPAPAPDGVAHGPLAATGPATASGPAPSRAVIPSGARTAPARAGAPADGPPDIPRERPVKASAEGRGASPLESTARGDAEVLLRRLRELGELRRDGVLTAKEFATAKKAVLRRL